MLANKNRTNALNESDNALGESEDEEDRASSARKHSASKNDADAEGTSSSSSSVIGPIRIERISPRRSSAQVSSSSSSVSSSPKAKADSKSSQIVPLSIWRNPDTPLEAKNMAWFTEWTKLYNTLACYIKRKESTSCFEMKDKNAKCKIAYARAIQRAIGNSKNDKDSLMDNTLDEGGEGMDIIDFYKSELYQICVKFKVWGQSEDSDPVKKLFANPLRASTMNGNR